MRSAGGWTPGCPPEINGVAWRPADEVEPLSAGRALAADGPEERLMSQMLSRQQCTVGPGNRDFHRTGPLQWRWSRSRRPGRPYVRYA